MNSIGLRLSPDGILGFGAGYGIYKTTGSLVYALIVGICFSCFISFIRYKNKKRKI